MGFLKFMLAVAMVIAGIFGVGISFLGCIGNGVASSMVRQQSSSGAFWIMGIIAFIVFLGGIYMLKRKV